MNKLDKRKIKIDEMCLSQKKLTFLIFLIFSFFPIYAIYSIIFLFMQYSSAFPAEKFSIKHKLSLSLAHLNQSSPVYSSPSQTDQDNLR